MSGVLSLQYLILPRDGDTACDELVVEVIVCGVKVHTFDSGELLDVQNIFTVNSPRLKDTMRKGWDEEEENSCERSFYVGWKRE